MPKHAAFACGVTLVENIHIKAEPTHSMYMKTLYCVM